MKQGQSAKSVQAHQVSAAAQMPRTTQLQAAGGTGRQATVAQSPQISVQRKMIGAVNASPHMTAQARQIDGAFGAAVQKRGAKKDELQKKTHSDTAQRAPAKEELKKGGKK